MQESSTLVWEVVSLDPPTWLHVPGLCAGGSQFGRAFAWSNGPISAGPRCAGEEKHSPCPSSAVVAVVAPLAGPQ